MNIFIDSPHAISPPRSQRPPGAWSAVQQRSPSLLSLLGMGGGRE